MEVGACLVVPTNRYEGRNITVAIYTTLLDCAFILSEPRDTC